MAEVFDAKKVATLSAEKKKYWEGIGVDVSKATDLNTAIHMGKLDFTVSKYPISFDREILVYDEEKKDDVVKTEHYAVPNAFATVNNSTLQPLGVVGSNYKILNNIDAFNFLDSIIAAGNAQFQTCGTIGSDAKSFITVSTEPIEILGDKFDGNILFINSHDGSSSVKACMTPIRCACANTISLAFKEASNKISIRHCSSLEKKLEAAKEVLLQNSNYLKALKKESERLAVKKFSRDAYLSMVKALNPINTDAKHIEVETERNSTIINQLMKAYDQTDLDNFVNSGYRALQAIADFESHKPIFRETKLAPYAAINTVIKGMSMSEQALNYINAYV